MRNTKKMTEAMLITMLVNWKGCTPASLQTVTTPVINAMGKKLFGTVTKVAYIGCMIGYVYENSVNNELERENLEREFMAQQLWKGKGKRITKALATHVEKRKLYLTYKYQQTFKQYYFDSEMNPISASVIKQYFYDSKPKNQGVAEGREILHREIELCNVRRLTFNKTTHEIAHG